MPALPPETVFTVDQALAVGWTSSALKHGVHCGRLVRVRRGVYAVAGAPDPLRSIRAAALGHPAALISHGSAALVHGLPLLGAAPRLPQLTLPPRATGNLRGVQHYRAGTRPEDVACVDGIAVTSVARTLVDLARHRPTAAAVAAIDHALHNGMVTPDELAEVLRHCWTWPRIRRAQRAIRLADGRAESPLESVSRLTLRWLGLPPAQPQQVILDQGGAEMGRLDFYWDEYGVAGEADGRTKFDPSRARFAVGDALNLEKDRQEAMEDLHLTFARWRWEHTTWRRHALRDKVLAAFARGRARDRAGIERRWTVGPAR